MNKQRNVLDKGFITLIDFMGAESSITQSARVSTGSKGKDDEKLLKYLLTNKHLSPFEMIELKFHIKCPIFVARQWFRHRTASINEVSGRYTHFDLEFYRPTKERIKGKGIINKQGSEGEVKEEVKEEFLKDIDNIYNEIEKVYNKYQISNEINRIILPLSTYTEFFWKIDLRNLLHFLELRNHPHSQYEIRVYANEIENIIKEYYPNVYKYWKKDENIDFYKYYATVTDEKGNIGELEVTEMGEFDCYDAGLKGELKTNAKIVNCVFNNLTSIIAPNAKEVYCEINELTTLDSPNAKIVYCGGNNLTTLNLPSAEEVFCNNNQLTSLDLPNAKYVYCENNKLTSLDAPNAKEVYCEKNTDLKMKNIKVPTDCIID